MSRLKLKLLSRGLAKKSANRHDFSQILACTFLHSLTVGEPLMVFAATTTFCHTHETKYRWFFLNWFINSMWSHITPQMAKSLHLQEKVERHLLKVKENNFDMSYNKKKKMKDPLEVWRFHVMTYICTVYSRWTVLLLQLIPYRKSFNCSRYVDVDVI